MDVEEKGSPTTQGGGDVGRGGGGVRDAETGEWAVHEAAQRGDRAGLNELLTQRHDPNLQNPSGERPLHLAARAGHAGCCELLIENGADAEAPNLQGQTPLHYAARAGKNDCITLLLNSVDPDRPDANGWTPLHYASEGDHLEGLKLLLEGGADVSPSSSSTTPLHLAARSGHLGSILLLLNHGAKLDAKDPSGNYPLSLFPLPKGDKRRDSSSRSSSSGQASLQNLRSLSADLRTLLGDSKLSDVTFSIQGTSFHAHRCVLFARCPRLLSGNVSEEKEGRETIVVQGSYSQEAFSGFLEFLYCGRIEAFEAPNPSQSKIVGALELALAYEHTTATEHCIQSLTDGLSEDNFSSLLTSSTFRGLLQHDDSVAQTVSRVLGEDKSKRHLSALQARYGELYVSGFGKIAASNDLSTLDPKVMAQLLKAMDAEGLLRPKAEAATNHPGESEGIPERRDREHKRDKKRDKKERRDRKDKKDKKDKKKDRKRSSLQSLGSQPTSAVQSSQPAQTPASVAPIASVTLASVPSTVASSTPQQTPQLPLTLPTSGIRTATPSSISANYIAPMEGKNLLLCKKLLKDLSKSPTASPFLEPVNLQEWPSYTTIVSNPMDLGTIKTRLEKEFYQNIDQFAADVRLVFTNAMLFNLEDSWIYTVAKKLLAGFQKKYNSTKFTFYPLSGGSVAGASASTPSTETFNPVATGKKRKPEEVDVPPFTSVEKEMLGDMINKLNAEQLLELLELMRRRGIPIPPQDEIDDVEINMDDLDVGTLRALERYVKSCLSKQKSHHRHHSKEHSSSAKKSRNFED